MFLQIQTSPSIVISHNFLLQTSPLRTSLTPNFTPKPPLLRALPLSSSTRFSQTEDPNENWGYGEASGSDIFEFDVGVAMNDLKNLDSPTLEVEELEELPEQWRRAKLAWLCKELPSHKTSTWVRILNAQKKWVTRENVKYIGVHFMRIRDNEAAFKLSFAQCYGNAEEEHNGKS
ncbi:hypothetical protein GIB67_018431 [Kingdonia uniflora]|uniref:Uncharacterized protein n=1 Tax=Kingdonia uniflora TaxID=39325 RepID=A0A7J7LJL5_9MAGN|nr:hypothetical protein GIB67_018431 [Kingdonia uniflora]